MKPINKFCPRSGKEIAMDSVTFYRTFPVGYSNPDYRNDFEINIENCLEDKKYFDILIKELEIDKKAKFKTPVPRCNLMDFFIFENNRY